SARLSTSLSVEQWATYVERFEHFVTANEIEEDKKSAFLLSVMGAATYELLRSLVAPDKPGLKSYDDIVSVLQLHFSLKPIVIAERFRCTERLNTEAIQKRLLTEPALTFQKAVEVAVAMEMVAKEMHQLSNALKVNVLSLTSQQCYKCVRFQRLGNTHCPSCEEEWRC
uniref:Uncharacterized protein n=1 Tax=Sander lucioperca TaxID=283035 RepID=A0A8D0A2F8_SANLU